MLFLDDNLIPRSSLNNMKRSQSIITTVETSVVPGFKKRSKWGLSKENKRYENQNKFMPVAGQSLRTTQSTEVEVFGQLIAKAMAKIRDGDIKEELKIEIQQLIFGANQRSHVN